MTFIIVNLFTQSFELFRLSSAVFKAMQVNFNAFRFKFPYFIEHINNSAIIGRKGYIKGNDIYLGFGIIAGLEESARKQILSERADKGEFLSLYDFVKRLPMVSIEQLRILIRVGAFNFIGKNKKELLWEAHSLINPAKKPQAMKELFDIKPKKYQLPELTHSWLDDAFDEIELLGFSLCSPFLLLKESPELNLRARELKDHIGKTVEIMGYMVTYKVTHTSRGDRMCFGTFLDREGLWIDTVHFPPSLQAYPFRGQGCYVLKGKVVEEFDFISMEVTEMRHLAMLNPEDDRELAEKRESLIT